MTLKPIPIEDGFRFDIEFHNFMFNYVIRDKKWFLLITDNENHPMTSEIPLKSKPYELKPTYVKMVQDVFKGEYPNELGKIHSILEEISVVLNANALKNIDIRKAADLKKERLAQPGGEFITVDDRFDHVLFAKWLIEESEHYFLRIRQTDTLYYYIDGVYINFGETYLEELIQDIMKWSVEITTYHIKEILGYIKRSCIKEIDIMEVHGEQVACNNGVINLRTKKLELHSPENYIFKKIPWNYIPDAECPEFEALIKKLLQNKEFEEYKFNLMVGYPLINSYTYNKIYFLEGKPGSGKSTLINIIRHIYSDVSNVNLHDLIKRPHMRAGLIGTFANFSGDASKEPIEDAAILKTLSGESYIDIDIKNVAMPVRYHNTSKLIIDTNMMPKFDLTDDAIFRRIIKIHFDNIIKEADKTSDFMDKHTTDSEMEGIFRKAVDFAHKILIDENPFKSTSIAASKEEYEIARQNSVDKFIKRHTQKLPKGVSNKSMVQAEMWLVYKAFADSIGLEPEERPNVTEFYKAFLIKGDFEIKNQWIPHLKKVGNCYLDVKLKNVERLGLYMDE